MKKFLALLLTLITIMSLCLVACTKPDNNNDDANDTEEEIVEIETPNVRGKTDVVFTDNNDGTIYFGMYPQTKVTDQTLLTKLNEKIGTLPTANALGLWTAHDFVNANNYFGDYKKITLIKHSVTFLFLLLHLDNRVKTLFFYWRF